MVTYKEFKRAYCELNASLQPMCNELIIDVGTYKEFNGFGRELNASLQRTCSELIAYLGTYL